MKTITELGLTHREAVKFVATRTCGICQSALTLPWGGIYNIQDYVIRCAKDRSHDAFAKTKSFTQMYEDNEPLPLTIANKIERRKQKEMERNVQKHGLTGKEIIRYQASLALTEEQATKVLMAIWPKAPAPEVYKAALVCHQYHLNPLMKHVYLIPFKEKDENGNVIGEKWETVLGIGATRLIASRRDRYHYHDGPRVMSQDEQIKYFGTVDEANLCVIVILEDSNGNRAPGFGRWPLNRKVKGAEKGNTQYNMAAIRSERNAFDRLFPGEMPTGYEVVEEQFMPDVDRVPVVDEKTGEIIDAVATEVVEAEEKVATTPEQPLDLAKEKTRLYNEVMQILQLDERLDRAKATAWLYRVTGCKELADISPEQMSDALQAAKKQFGGA